MLITPVIFAIAALPAALYLLLAGRYRLSRRPIVTTGWRDTALLGIAVMGLVAIGPMQLFFPTYAAARFAGWVWGMLAALYLLTLFLVVLASRPATDCLCVNEESFLAVLLAAAKSVDEQALYVGQVLTLPTIGMQLVIETDRDPRCAASQFDQRTGQRGSMDRTRTSPGETLPATAGHVASR